MGEESGREGRGVRSMAKKKPDEGERKGKIKKNSRQRWIENSGVGGGDREASEWGGRKFLGSPYR